jgi:DNA sulfur modification protein DndD
VDQVFALSLVAAIAKVSGKPVPFVIDTPLARLDTAHRVDVLQYFAWHGGEQIILLSQPDEVHGPYFEEIADGVGKAHVHEGYFTSEED